MYAHGGHHAVVHTIARKWYAVDDIVAVGIGISAEAELVFIGDVRAALRWLPHAGIASVDESVGAAEVVCQGLHAEFLVHRPVDE